MRLFYAAGPGNVVGTYGHWKEGQDDPSQVSMTYSGQFFSLCEELGATGEIISSCGKGGSVSDGRFLVSNLPKAHMGSGIPAYMLEQVRYGLVVSSRALSFGADVAVVAEGTSFWFVFSRLAHRKVRVIPALHCVLWPKLLEPSKFQRVINRLDAVFFRRHAWRILSASNDITAQVRRITGGRHAPVISFLPTYRLGTFESIPSADHQSSPFTLLFAGRIEENKGVFDLLEAASIIRGAGRSNVRFDLCGDGSSLERLRDEVGRRGLFKSFFCHGHCNREEMFERFASAHAVVVPTRSDFVEGFNQVIVEGVLSGRPVITSRVCPALDYVRDAVIEVPADSPIAYARAILALADDRDRYEALCRQCRQFAPPFFDPKYGWKEGLKSILLHAPGRS